MKHKYYNKTHKLDYKLYGAWVIDRRRSISNYFVIVKNKRNNIYER